MVAIGAAVELDGLHGSMEVESQEIPNAIRVVHKRQGSDLHGAHCDYRSSLPRNVGARFGSGCEEVYGDPRGVLRRWYRPGIFRTPKSA